MRNSVSCYPYGSSAFRSDIQSMKRLRLALILLFFQCILIILFVAFAFYYPDADASDKHNSIPGIYGGFPPENNTAVKHAERKCNQLSLNIPRKSTESTLSSVSFVSNYVQDRDTEIMQEPCSYKEPLGLRCFLSRSSLALTFFLPF